MAGYSVTIEGGQIQVYIDGNMSEDEAYIIACNKIQEALKKLRGEGIYVTPLYRKVIKINRDVDPDPR